jgi:peptide deformylase
VRRARKIRVRAYDLDGKLVEYEADELYGRAVQHETDHLAGKLFIDYLDPQALRSVAEKIRDFEVQFRKAQRGGELPDDAELVKRLDAIERAQISKAAITAQP